MIAEQASRVGMPYVDQRWLGGMLTNYKTIRQSIKRLMIWKLNPKMARLTCCPRRKHCRPA